MAVATGTRRVSKRRFLCIAANHHIRSSAMSSFSYSERSTCSFSLREPGPHSRIGLDTRAAYAAGLATNQVVGNHIFRVPGSHSRHLITAKKFPRALRYAEAARIKNGIVGATGNG